MTIPMVFARLPRMRIGTRFAVVLGLLVAGTVALGVVALSGTAQLHGTNDRLVAAANELGLARATQTRLARFGEHLELYLLSGDRRLERALQRDVVGVEESLAAQKSLFRVQPGPLRLTLAEERPYREMIALWHSAAGRRAAAGARRTPLAAALERDTQAINVAGEGIARRTSALTLATEKRSAASFHDTRQTVIAVLIAIALAGVLVALWLARTVVPRTRRYADFAGRVAGGDLRSRLPVRGGDELDQLGLRLNEMVDRRAQEADHAAAQAEFNDALQVTANEEEAHAVLKLHIERSIPGSQASVLNRNNSDDRLELKTAVPEESPLSERTSAADPRACLAVRHARPHREGAGTRPPLMSCTVCGGLPGTKSCNPLLVGGEVIGSVLVTTPAPTGERDEERLRESIVQAAPVLANLRNLAIAELRAATDALTGLPNARSVRDTIKRMVAQASRTQEPLAAALVDLDHFKQINDTFGHGSGDDALAAVGAVLREAVRESDFVGRMGGEEFLLLLPSTAAAGALEVCEKIRTTLMALHVAGVERDISASFGVAIVPDHAGDADALLREADRALYAAKEAGRNRVCLARPSEAARERAPHPAR